MRNMFVMNFVFLTLKHPKQICGNHAEIFEYCFHWLLERKSQKYTCVVCACIFLSVFTHKCGSLYKDVRLISGSSLISDFILWGRFPQWSPALTNSGGVVSLASFLMESPVSSFWGWNYRKAATASWHLYGFWASKPWASYFHWLNCLLSPRTAQVQGSGLCAVNQKQLPVFLFLLI